MEIKFKFSEGDLITCDPGMINWFHKNDWENVDALILHAQKNRYNGFPLFTFVIVGTGLGEKGRPYYSLISPTCGEVLKEPQYFIEANFTKLTKVDQGQLQILFG